MVVKHGRQDVIQIAKDTSSTNQNVTIAEPNAPKIMTFLIISVTKSTSTQDAGNQINERIGEYMDSRADEKKPTAENTVSTAEVILSELKDIKSYVARLTGFVAELAGYSIED